MKKSEGSFDKLYKGLEKTAVFTTCLMLSAMVVVVFMNVIFRYFLNASIAWTEEVSRFMFIWLVFLGANLAYIKDEHLGLDVLINAVPKPVAKLIQIVADILVLYGIFLVIKGGYNIMMSSWDWKSPAIALPYAYVYMIVPISGTVFFLQAAFKLIKHIKFLFSKEEATC
ncbi:TRAP transporter small permease [Petroclostridium sp. X23]|uniref:TRAP transporter small permease n=1 Tax=Petroclostridium sp. X23 TaxID=3045146 RepID=UPI0024AD8DC0|nr:TRAP transporter small permease [Petroclostridium sp. X23]WHH59367.1 TRAP transporter small permease [Petroclostridium sp. X23]WHH59372.1 TRAP transporter small permease [Petroclostridium sp. X23]